MDKGMSDEEREVRIEKILSDWVGDPTEVPHFSLALRMIMNELKANRREVLQEAKLKCANIVREKYTWYVGIYDEIVEEIEFLIEEA